MSARRPTGFSLIELMVVLVITAIVVGYILSIFAGQILTYEGQRAAVEVQDDARLVSDLILHDLRMAGFMMPPAGGVSGLDGGNGAADRLCVSDPSVLDDDQVEAASDRFEGAILASDLNGGSSADLVAGELDVDGDGAADFAVNAGVILVEGTDTHCARITGLGGGNIQFTPAVPAGFDANAPNARAIPAIVYEIGAGGLLRNNLVVSRQVEDLQVEYGVDANDDGQIVGAGEFPLHGLIGNEPTLLRIVRLSVLTRTTLEDPQLPNGSGRPAVANRVAAGTPDAFRRRLVTASAAPRNLL